MGRDSNNLRISDQKFNPADGLRPLGEVIQPIVERVIERGPRPYGCHRKYSEAELKNDARLRDHRADVRPVACNGTEKCWVELGRPGWEPRLGHGQCAGCGGTPAYPRWNGK